MADSSRWEGSFEDARRRHLMDGLGATPAQRLAWLEEMIGLAHRSGALPRARAMAARSVKRIGRKATRTGLAATNDLLKLVVRLRRGKPFMPKGVARFKSFEEAQLWSIEMMSRAPRQ